MRLPWIKPRGRRPASDASGAPAQSGRGDGERYVFRGKAYRSFSVATLAHKLWFEEQRAAAGMVEFEMRPGESADDFARRTLTRLCSNGSALKVLGGLLMPEGSSPEEWTPDVAERIASELGAVTDERETAQIMVLMLSTLIDFFVRGRSSIWTTRPSSQAVGGDPPDERALLNAIAMAGGAV